MFDSDSHRVNLACNQQMYHLPGLRPNHLLDQPCSLRNNQRGNLVDNHRCNLAYNQVGNHLINQVSNHHSNLQVCPVFAIVVYMWLNLIMFCSSKYAMLLLLLYAYGGVV